MPPPCRKELMDRGVGVFMVGLSGVSAEDFEVLVRAVADLSGCLADWHFCGGRAVVMAFESDAPLVTAACCAYLPGRMGNSIWKVLWDSDQVPPSWLVVSDKRKP